MQTLARVRKDALTPSGRDGCFLSTHCETCPLNDCIENLTSLEEKRLLALSQPVPEDIVYIKAIKERRALVGILRQRGLASWRIGHLIGLSQQIVERDL